MPVSCIIRLRIATASRSFSMHCSRLLLSDDTRRWWVRKYPMASLGKRWMNRASGLRNGDDRKLTYLKPPKATHQGKHA